MFDELNPRDLHYCIVLASELNMVRASALLSVTQSTLSHALKRTENSLGVQLFLRTQHGLELTIQGKRFADKAKLALRELSSIKQCVRPLEFPSGTYSIGCHVSVGLYSLPASQVSVNSESILQKLLTEYSELNFSIKTGNSRDLTAQVMAKDLDFAIAVNPEKHENLVVRLLSHDTFTLFTSLKKTSKESSKIIPLLYFDPNLFQSAFLLSALSKQNFIVKKLLQVSGLEMVAALASQNAAALLPSRVALRYPKLRKQEEIPNLPFHKDTINLIYRLETLNTPASKILARRLEQELKYTLNSNS